MLCRPLSKLVLTVITCMVITIVSSNQLHPNIHSLSTIHHTSNSQLSPNDSLKDKETSVMDRYSSFYRVNHPKIVCQEPSAPSKKLETPWSQWSSKTETDQEHFKEIATNNSSDSHLVSNLSMITSNIIYLSLINRNINSTADRSSGKENVDDEALGNLLSTIVLEELSQCVVMVAADEGYWSSLVIPQLLRLPNTRQVMGFSCEYTPAGK